MSDDGTRTSPVRGRVPGSIVSGVVHHSSALSFFRSAHGCRSPCVLCTGKERVARDEAKTDPQEPGKAHPINSNPTLVGGSRVSSSSPSDGGAT